MAEPVDVTWLGERLKRARNERGETLKQVAEATEISVATLSRIERGEAKELESYTLLALSEWLGTPVEEMVERPELPSVRTQRGKSETPDIIELHLRADKNLDKQTATALAKMFRAAYESLTSRTKK